MIHRLTVLTTLLLCAGAPPRAPTDAERAAFFDFYHQSFPDDHGQQPVFALQEQAHARPVIVAHVDSPPRLACALCRMERRVFENKGRWTVDASAPVRLARRACLQQLRPVELQFPMPDADVAGLLEHERAVLASALAVWRQFAMRAPAGPGLHAGADRDRDLGQQQRSAGLASCFAAIAAAAPRSGCGAAASTTTPGM
ncbi:hypothetical protein LP420_05440 [Massilia sp. B-10]|nr:hypothetical protein LP420_05440 [Massilia sp. B-10]